MGVCRYQYTADQQSLVKVQARPNQANLAVTLVHKYTHALLHSGVDAECERSKREVGAEAVGYVVGWHFGLNTSGSAFYLAAWDTTPEDGFDVCFIFVYFLGYVKVLGCNRILITLGEYRREKHRHS